jgi:hypothetical protein
MIRRHRPMTARPRSASAPPAFEGLPSTIRPYLRQSAFTDPGYWSDRFYDLPSDVPGLCHVVQGLIVHYRYPEDGATRIPPHRLQEINLRYTEAILGRAFDLDPRPLIDPRPANQRVVGCCRDFAVLFCAMARHQGIPCRIRVGFSTYFRRVPVGFRSDHTIAEHWDRRAGHWTLVDPEMTEPTARANRLTFSPLNVPRSRFLVGGRAWVMCRDEGENPDSFGVGPQDGNRGLWFVRSRLLHDLAALNRREMLLWDSWRAAGPKARLGERALHELDQMAHDISAQDVTETIAKRYFRTPRWRAPRRIECYSPVSRRFAATLRK